MAKAESWLTWAIGTLVTKVVGRVGLLRLRERFTQFANGEIQPEPRVAERREECWRLRGADTICKNQKEFLKQNFRKIGARSKDIEGPQQS